MANLMDSVSFKTPQQPTYNILDLVQRAKQDPLGFEEYVKRTNPQAYQQAMQIRNCANPKAMVLQMAQQQGIDPNILKMLDLH